MDARVQNFILALEDEDPVVWQDKVIEASRDPSSPTYNRFPWDKDEAARREWRRIASDLIARVQNMARYVTVEEPEPKPVRAVFVDEDEDTGHRRYRTAVKLQQEPEAAAVVVVREGRHCLGYLRAWINSTAGNFGYDPIVLNQHYDGLKRWLDDVEGGEITPSLLTADEMAARPAPARRKRTAKAKRSDDRPGASA